MYRCEAEAKLNGKRGLPWLVIPVQPDFFYVGCSSFADPVFFHVPEVAFYFLVSVRDLPTVSIAQPLSKFV